MRLFFLCEFTKSVRTDAFFFAVKTWNFTFSVQKRCVPTASGLNNLQLISDITEGANSSMIESAIENIQLLARAQEVVNAATHFCVSVCVMFACNCAHILFEIMLIFFVRLCVGKRDKKGLINNSKQRR